MCSVISGVPALPAVAFEAPGAWFPFRWAPFRWLTIFRITENTHVEDICIRTHRFNKFQDLKTEGTRFGVNGEGCLHANTPFGRLTYTVVMRREQDA